MTIRPRMTTKRFYISLLSALIILPCPTLAEDIKGIPYIKEGVIDTTKTETLGLKQTGEARTVTVFSPKDDDWHYANGAVVTAFKDVLYCMWQSSLTDEDAPETRVVYSCSRDEGMTWSTPRVLIEATDSSITIQAEFENILNNIEADEENPVNLIITGIKSGVAERTISLAEEITKEEISAKYDNGVLFVTIPKKEIPKTKIDIE